MFTVWMMEAAAGCGGWASSNSPSEEEAEEWTGEFAMDAEAEEMEEAGEAVAKGFVKVDTPVTDTM
jgi:hypothetical protein